MLKKQLYWTVGVIIFLFIVLGSVFCYQIRQDTLSARGQYTFKNTKNNIAKLSAIKINTAQSGEINMYLKDGAWYMKEAKDYFINPQALANFFNMINNSLVITKQKNFSKNFPSNNLLTEEESKNFVGMGTEIKTYDDNGNLLDDVIIGRPTGKSGHFFARQMKTAHQQIISGAEKFSGSAVDWLPLPLLQIEQKLVKMVDINGYSLDAEQLYFLWENSGLIKDFFAVLKNINYQGIIYRDEFFESSGEIIPQQLRITMMGGLIYNKSDIMQLLRLLSQRSLRIYVSSCAYMRSYVIKCAYPVSGIRKEIHGRSYYGVGDSHSSAGRDVSLLFGDGDGLHIGQQNKDQEPCTGR